MRIARTLAEWDKLISGFDTEARQLRALMCIFCGS